MTAKPIHGAYTRGVTWTIERPYCVVMEDRTRPRPDRDYLADGGATYSYADAQVRADELNGKGEE